MRIAINCRSFLKKQYTGIGRYSFHLVKFLGEIDATNEYYLYAKKGFFDFQRRIPKFSAKNFVVKVDRFNGGLDKILGDVDIYHSPSPAELDISKAKKIVVTVHDLVYKKFPESHTKETIASTDRYLTEIVQRADKIICCSKNTLSDFKEFFPVSDEKVSLVYQGVDKNIFRPLTENEEIPARQVVEAKGVSGPFILFVGTIEPRKNLENLIRAMVILKRQGSFGGKLVVIGMKGWMTESIAVLIDGLGLKDDVLFLGYVSDEELRYFYALAEVFVFPSLYEGFGFPIVEAMSCGATVITSNVSSCPEVARDGAILVDPHHVEGIAGEIQEILKDPERKRTLREKALHRAKEFSFLKTAQETLKIYEEVYG